MRGGLRAEIFSQRRTLVGDNLTDMYHLNTVLEKHDSEWVRIPDHGDTIHMFERAKE